KVAAIGDSYADGSVGNVTGSNAVNVFLGIGIAWSIAAIYHYANGTKFEVSAGSLGFSVTIFCILACVAILLLLLRRRPPIKGELGGPNPYKILSGLFLIALWLLYVLLAALENYCYIEGF
ncbi:Sodium/calcium exchanger 3, partial [Cichlidogyrus casuarinus]